MHKEKKPEKCTVIEKPLGVHDGKKPEKCTVIEKPSGVHDGKKPEKSTVIEKPSGVHKEKKPEKCTVVEKPLHKCGKCEKTFEILSDLESHGCQKNPFYDDSKDTKGKVNPYSNFRFINLSTFILQFLVTD